MTIKETIDILTTYQELKSSLIAQSELIMSIFKPLSDREHVTEVKPDVWHINEHWIVIWYHWSSRLWGDCADCFSCPERYLGMTEDELRAEKTRIEEKRKAEKARKEKDERYKKYLELKKEFEGKNGKRMI